MHARRGRLGIAGAMAATSLAAVAAAFAAQTPGATYTGTTSSGGSVKLQVAGDGSLTGLAIDPGMTECGFHPLVVNQLPGIPITGGAFTYTTGSWTVSGQFSDAQNAQGRAEYRRAEEPACTMTPRTWTASLATATPTPPVTTPTATPTSSPMPGLTIKLSGPKTQLPGRRIVIKARTNSAGTATATGAVIVRRGGKPRTFTLKTLTAQLKPGTTRTLRMPVSSRARKAIRGALRHHGTVTATITVTASNAAGNVTTASRTITVSR